MAETTTGTPDIRRRGPRPGTPRGPRMSRSERERQLLDVAEEVFAELGFTETTMEEIASRAGITKPVIYDHFGSKERLLVAVVARARQQLVDCLDAAVRDVPRDAPLEVGFRAGIEAFFTFFEGRRHSFHVYQQEAAVLAAAGGDVEEHRLAIIRAISGWINRLSGPVEIPPVLLEGMAGIVVAANEHIAGWRLRHPEIDKDTAVGLVMAALWTGMESLSRHLQPSR